MTLPSGVPAPLEWHPAYRDHTELLDWLEGRTGHCEVVFTNIARALHATDDPGVMDQVPRRRILTRRKAWGPAPYVGEPFVYVWYCAVDELGRGIAGDARVVYIPNLATMTT